MPKVLVTLHISIENPHEIIDKANSLGLDLDELITDIRTAVTAHAATSELNNLGVVEYIDVERLDVDDDHPDVDQHDWFRASLLLSEGVLWSEIHRRCPQAVIRAKHKQDRA